MSVVKDFVSNLSVDDKSKIVDVFVEKIMEYENESTVIKLMSAMLEHVTVVPEKGQAYDYLDIKLVGSMRSY